MNNTNCNQTINSWKKFMMHFKKNTILLLPKKTSTLLISRHNLKHCKRNFKIIWRGMKKLLKKRMSILIIQSKKRMSFLIVQSKKKTIILIIQSKQKTTIYLKLSKKRTIIYLKLSKKRTIIYLTQSKKRTTISLKQ